MKQKNFYKNDNAKIRMSDNNATKRKPVKLTRLLQGLALACLVLMLNSCFLLAAALLSDTETASTQRTAVSDESYERNTNSNRTTQQRPPMQWRWYSGSTGRRTNSGFGSNEYQKGFYYCIVYCEGSYCYCISKAREWYIMDSRGKLTKISTSDVPYWVREMVE